MLGEYLMIRREGYKLCFNDFTNQLTKAKNQSDEFKAYKDADSIELAWSIISALSAICCAAAYGLNSLYNQ